MKDPEVPWLVWAVNKSLLRVTPWRFAVVIDTDTRKRLGYKFVHVSGLRGPEVER